MSDNNTKCQSNGIVHLTFSYKRIDLVLLDNGGKLLMDRSLIGIMGNESSETQADIMQKVVEPIKKFGINKVSVIIKGTSCVREITLSAIRDSGVKITSIKEATPLPHNDCRPNKNKRC